MALPHLSDGYVLLLDSDMELEADAIEAHVRIAASTGAISVGAVIYRNASTNVWAGYLMRRGRHRYAHAERVPFTQFTTANALVKAVDILAVGGFDERFTGYGGEDLDLALRLQQRAGGSFINNREAVAMTTEPKPWMTAIDQLEEYGCGNLRLLTELHPAAPLTFDLGRRASRRLRDRVFVAMLNPLVGTIVRAVLRIPVRAVQYRLLNYEVIAAVHRGYLAQRQ